MDDRIFEINEQDENKEQQCIIIGIAGGTGSGKSTFTRRIKEAFGDQVTVIYHDNYYRRNDGIPFEERKKINYDHPDALETDLLIEHLTELRHGRPIQCPVYDYAVHNRSDKTIPILPSRVILVEGILVLSDERLRDLLDIKIYVEADADERILRRALRDMEERGRDLRGIIDQYLTTVKPMHYLYVEPTKAKADIVINSGRNKVAFDIVKARIMQLL
jgi:uridine kinase